jgi:hypothetical protein
MFKSVAVKRLILIFLACSAIVLTLTSLSSAQQPDKSETLKKARQSYYSLKDEGLTEFQCTMAPNWAFLLADQRKADPTAWMPPSKDSKPCIFAFGSVSTATSRSPRTNSPPKTNK